MLKLKLLIVFTLLFLSFFSMAQRGKDGAKTVSAANTIVNEYTTLTANATAGATSITVSNSSLNANGRFSGALAPGDLIMIIQVQGTTLQTGVQTKQWGKILNYNNCGLYEFEQVLTVPNSTTITIECGLINNYTSTGKIEVIRVPRFSSLTINSPGNLTGDAWNGTTGGICVIEVLGSTIINAGGKMDMSGKGFRGGILNDQVYAWGVDNYYWPTNDYGAEKGEGIAGFETDYDALGGRYCRGAPANGGGGANTHNHGGGGGANAGDTTQWTGKGNPDISTATWAQAWDLEGAGFSTSTSSGGGRGGYSYSSSNQNALVVGAPNTAWSGDNRNNNGGLGGRPLDYSTGRIYLGGGGGAGEQNDTYGTSGANGGGIIFIQSYGSIGGSGQIISNGATAANSTSGNVGSGGADGAGGGGGGGTIIIKSTGAASGITATANGGNGGSQVINAAYNLSQHQAEGPGGGGGGGYIAISSGTITRTANGGANGTSNSSGVTEFPPNGATKGDAGINNAAISYFYIDAPDDTICSGTSATLNSTLMGTVPTGTTIYWYDAIVGGNVLATGTSFTTPVLSTTTIYYVGTCQGTYHQPVTVYINTATANAGTDATICSGQSTLLNGTGGGTYSWSPAIGLSSTTIANPVASPTITTTYTLTVTTSTGCTTTDQVIISVSGTISANAGVDVTICPGSSTNLSASGGITYAWSPAAGLSSTTVANPVASPATTTSYIVTVTNVSGCTDADTVVVTVSMPVLANAGNDTTICSGGGSAQLHATGGTTFAWSPSTGLSSTSVPNPIANPTATTTYIVTVTNASGCTGTSSVTVTVGSNLSISVTPNTPTICPGASVQLNASGATTYAWSPGTGLSSTTGTTVTANPNATTIYTVNGTDGTGCSGSTTVTISVAPLTASASATNENCGQSNGSATVAAVGTCTSGFTYQWNTLPQQTTQTANNLSAGNYTVLVTCGACSVTATAIISNTASPSATVTNVVDATCGQVNGSATISPVGGTSPYTYQWSNGQTGTNLTAVAAGTYTVTVQDANNCTAVNTVNIGSSPGPSITVTNTVNASCFLPNGSATVSASGGTQPYNYTWSTTPIQTGPNLQNIAAGNYNVTVSDANGCTSFSSVTIGQTGGLIVTATSSDEDCNLGNGTITVNASQGTGSYSYMWSTSPTQSSNTVTGLSAGTYTVTVSDGVCNVTTSVTVNSSPGPTAQFSANPSTVDIYNSDVSFIDHSSGNVVSWQWNFGDGSPPATGEYVDHTYGSIGIYYVTLTIIDNNGCTDIYTDTIHVNDIFTLYIPNSFSPNDDGVNDVFLPKGLSVNPDDFNMCIFDRWGNLVFETSKWGDGWNGTYKNQGDPDYDIIMDVYVYHIHCKDLNGQKHQYIGRVTLLP